MWFWCRSSKASKLKYEAQVLRTASATLGRFGALPCALRGTK